MIAKDNMARPVVLKLDGLLSSRLIFVVSLKYLCT